VMSKVSVIIPARNELFLPQTVADLLAKGSDIEVIAVLDGYWPEVMPTEDPRLKYIHHSKPKGMRASINAAASLATGKYLMKVDAHCMFGEAYDEILAADCADNWIVIPRRYSLDAEHWMPTDKECIDYTYYFYPYLHPDDLGLHARPWWGTYAKERRHIEIDENISFQGSCWFMHRTHYWDRLGGMSEVGYETFMAEPQEIGFKTQLGLWEGAVMRNKRTWYAHLHKGKRYGRMYSMSKSERVRGNAYSWDFWWNNRWTERVRDIEWLIDRFMPMPNWPEDWKELKRANQPVHPNTQQDT